MKKTILLLVGMAIGVIGFSQKLTPIVLANAGGYADNQMHLSWTIGEVAVITLPSGDQTLFLTQGFQQPEHVGLVPVIEVAFADEHLLLNVYPNPAQAVLFVDWETTVSKANWHICLFDLNGRMVLEQPLQSTTEELDVSALASGMYFLRVFDGPRPIETTRVEIIR